MTRDRDDPTGSPVTARRDRLTGAITVAAILLFVGIGGAVLSPALRSYVSGIGGANRPLVIALLLNVALILFGWRRHRELAQAVTVHTAAAQQAQVLASRDPLTGLLNRRSLADQGGAMAMKAFQRHKAVAVLMLDLDRFKTINDRHGHTTGDALLRAVADLIVAMLPPTALVARIGGDEFACVLLFDAEHSDTVARTAERLISRLAQPLQVDGLQLHLSASIGVARSDTDGATIDALMRVADIALYAAKHGGRNRYVWFDQSMERALRDRDELESALRTAIPQHEIVPYFDRQIDLASGRLTGFEVLARWEHPSRGLIAPDAFFPVAEQTGLIADLTLSVMQQAFLQARDWDATLTLSVNLSPSQLKDAWLTQKIIKVLIETGFPANRLEIEITEAAMFENLVLVQGIIGSLKNQGIAIVLDDFGTGYSSLAHLRAVPFDRIKIDRSFVAAMGEDAESAAIVKAVTSLGDSLNLPITAEGIEDAGIADRLRHLGCAQGQGYLYGQPLSAVGVRKLLAEKRLLRGSPAAPGPDLQKTG